MGCASSKLDELPAVALCKERCNFLEQAMNERFNFAQSHIAYLQSLKTIGLSLNRFFHDNPSQDLDSLADGHFSDSPVVNLKQKDAKFVEDGGGKSKQVEHGGHPSNGHRHSSSGSHLQFDDDDDEEEEDDDSDGSLHSGNEFHHGGVLGSPSHHMGHGDGYRGVDYHNNGMMDQGDMMSRYNNYNNNGGGGFMHMNYMKKYGTPPILYEQKPMSPEVGYMGESSYFNPSNNNYYANTNDSNNKASSSSYPNYSVGGGGGGYGNYGVGGGGGGYGNYGGGASGYAGYGGGMNGTMGGYYSSAPDYGGGGGYGGGGANASPSTSKPPPPPPSPPKTSTWDFLNPFESYEKFYPAYTPSRNSRDVREEEGIPDLEDEDYQHEVLKEVHGHQKFVDAGVGSSSSGGNYTKSAVIDEDVKVKDAEAVPYQTRPSVSMESEAMEYEVHMVDKKVVDSKEKSAGAFKGGGPRGVSEFVREILVQFDKASDSGNELAMLLEVGKVPYHKKRGAYQVSSKIFQAITPSMSSMSMVSSQPSTSTITETSSSAETASSVLGSDEGVGTGVKNLSSTLHKLYILEKKLYNEVKAEEKMRVELEKRRRRLKRLDERGAEAQKVEVTRNLIRSLSTKIKIAIQVVDRTSVTINKIRDEELWPQLNELIQMLTRMWKSMLGCHHIQLQAIREARNIDAITARKKASDANVEATSQLEHELVSWTLKFSSWVVAQKGYVRALNNWLLKCLLYEPEETADGIAPFSPGRIGAPPVFIICNQWAQALERISEKEVVDSMRVFTMTVLQFWERDKRELRQSMVANKDLEKKVKNLDREDQKIQKEVQGLEKKILTITRDSSSLPLSEQVVYQSDTSNSSLQASMLHIFEAMERFTANSLKAYEEILQRSEEDRLAQQNARIS